MERKRKLYYTHSSFGIPKTTAWRLGKKIATTSKRRKVYLFDAKFSVPKSTLWWKKQRSKEKDRNSSESKMIEELKEKNGDYGMFEVKNCEQNEGRDNPGVNITHSDQFEACDNEGSKDKDSIGFDVKQKYFEEVNGSKTMEGKRTSALDKGYERVEEDIDMSENEGSSCFDEGYKRFEEENDKSEDEGSCELEEEYEGFEKESDKSEDGGSSSLKEGYKGFAEESDKSENEGSCGLEEEYEEFEKESDKSEDEQSSSLDDGYKKFEEGSDKSEYEGSCGLEEDYEEFEKESDKSEDEQSSSLDDGYKKFEEGSDKSEDEGSSELEEGCEEFEEDSDESEAEGSSGCDKGYEKNEEESDRSEDEYSSGLEEGCEGFEEDSNGSGDEGNNELDEEFEGIFDSERTKDKSYEMVEGNTMDKSELVDSDENAMNCSGIRVPKTNHSHTFSIVQNRNTGQLLYENASMTFEESIYSTYIFAIKNKLSYQATEQLLELLRLHLPQPNNYPKNVRALKKHFESMKVVEITSFCSLCLKKISNDFKKCPSPLCKSSSTSHYALLPFEEQLANIFSEKWELLQYPFTRKKISGVIQDIQDGSLYKKLQQPGGFLSVPENTGLILCSDGVQLFKSSNQSFWPILLAVTSLPPGIRMNYENIILAGVWQGTVKPNMDYILQKVLEKIDKISVDGIDIQSSHFNGTKNIKAKLLLAVFDLPARASATNFIQFNGSCSCLYCHDNGTHIAHRQLFLPDEKHIPRNKLTIEKDVATAERKGKVTCGVKGKSVLSLAIDITTAVPVDYMHSVLEGIARRLLSVCLDSKYHKHKFYLGRVTGQIDESIRHIKPPQEIRRSPRSILSMKQWKASEFRAWILYYCLPVLSGFLPSDYIYHLSLLVSSMHILLGDTITPEDIGKAHKQLTLFYKFVPVLYCQEICTANMHTVVHMSQFVLNWGPLWCYSCFGFESMNGHLRKNCHGTGYVLPQLIHTIRMRQVLLVRGQQMSQFAHPSTIQFVHSMLGIKKSSTLEIKGRVSHKIIDEHVLAAMKSAKLISFSVHTLSLPTCQAIRFNSIIYAKKKKKLKRDNSTCAFHHESGLKFGSIHNFCFCNKEWIVVIETFKYVNTSILNQVRPSKIQEFNDSTCHSINQFLYCVQKSSNSKEILAVPVSSLFVKCVHIPLKGVYDIIVTIPNMFEHH